MTVNVSANIHFDEADVWHRWHPGDDKCAAYGALKFKDAATLYFGEPALVDKVIAELVALRAEMVPEPEPAAHLCECGHFEAYHVGAVLSDEHPGQCTECDYGTCERFRPAAGKDEPASPDAAEALTAAIAAGTPLLVTDDEPENHPDTAGPTYGEAELRRADANRDHDEPTPGPGDGVPFCRCGHHAAVHSNIENGECLADECSCARLRRSATASVAS